MSEEPEQGESGKLQGSAANLERAPAAARRWRGWMLRGLGALALVLLLGAVGVARYLRSAQFQERARLFVIAQVERATGGRVELQGVRWSFARLEFELAGLVVHGKESQAEAPLLRTELVQARLQWAPLLRGRIALRELKVRRPLAHVDVYKDGSTNVPRPKLGPGARPDRIEEVLRLAVDHAELSDGLLQWNDEKIRLNGAADGVAVEVGYRAGDEHYEGTAKVNDVRLRVRDFEPMMLGASADFRLYRDRLEVPRLRVSQGHSWLEASGAITGLGSPVAQFASRGGRCAGTGTAGALPRTGKRPGAMERRRNLPLGSERICLHRQGSGGRGDVGQPDCAAGENQRWLCVFAGPRTLQCIVDLCHGAGRHGTRETGRQQFARQPAAGTDGPGSKRD